MKLTQHTNIGEFNAALREHMAHTGQSIAEAMREQGRLLAKRLIQFTPPKTRSQGLNAVRRDIRRAILQVKLASFGDHAAKKRIRRYIAEGRTHALETMARAGLFGNLYRDLEFLTSAQGFFRAHESQRDRRGRVLGKQKRKVRYATLDGPGLKAYLDRRLRHVGQAKGGWYAGLEALGGSAPQWITRHANSGRAEIRLNSRVKSIEFINRSAWSEYGDEERITENALRTRAQNIRDAIARAIEKEARS